MSVRLKVPRRRVEARLTISADSWEELEACLLGGIPHRIDRAQQEGSTDLTTVSVGYGSSWDLSISVDRDVNHQTWERAMRERRAKVLEGRGEHHG